MNDRAFVQTVDAAMAEAARLSGAWLVCRPGCCQCCLGSFSISQLDAARLRSGREELAAREPERAAAVRRRAADFPAADDDAPCPALDPESGLCDLYEARPITCRTFGPPVRCGEQDVGVCELCFQGASDEEIAACEVEIDPEDLESRLIGEVEASTGVRGETTVALALTAARRA